MKKWQVEAFSLTFTIPFQRSAETRWREENEKIRHESQPYSDFQACHALWNAKITRTENWYPGIASR